MYTVEDQSTDVYCGGGFRVIVIVNVCVQKWPLTFQRRSGGFHFFRLENKHTRIYLYIEIKNVSD